MKKMNKQYALMFVSLLVVMLSAVQSFMTTSSRPNRCTHTSSASRMHDDSVERPECMARREAMQKLLYFGIASTTFFISPVLPVSAAAVQSTEVVAKAFGAIRFELEDPAGGVSTMQQLIDNQNWASLMDFTKTYDQVLRKAKIGAAKKLLPEERQETATLVANAVTFDLIGINRASRKGQESVDLANKYLNELRDDVKKLLEMQKSVE